MTEIQISTAFCMLAAFTIMACVVITCCIKSIQNKRAPEKYNKAGVSWAFFLPVCILVSLFIIRRGIFLGESGENALPIDKFKEIFESFTEACRTFLFEEPYQDFFEGVKKMYETVVTSDGVFSAIGLWAWIIFASLLHLAAPVVGGAVVLALFVSVFPKLVLYFLFWKEKYYFSELNDSSLALAKSILKEKYSLFCKPLIIFTDIYVDEGNEKSSERVLEAKMIGAICLKDDLAHVMKNKIRQRKFFLVDEKGSENLQTLVNLSNKYNCRYLKKSEIYFFTNDDAYVQVEKSVRNNLLNSGFKKENLPTFIPVYHYSNLISNLLVDVPLYETLVGKKRDENGIQDLNVTILGTGFIGTEMFMTTYWMGQLHKCRLNINILSNETEECFWNKIDYINPEIRLTTDENNDILIYNKKGDRSEPYCKVNYYRCDVKSSKFISCLIDKDSSILDTDYFLVALGNDEDNISVANTVRQYVGHHHIRTENDEKTVIAYVVYDPALSDSLNNQTHFSYVNNKVDIYMRAIGSLYDVYSVKNVFMNEYDPLCETDDRVATSREERKKRAAIHEKRIKEDNYRHWSSLARDMHAKYKVYSMGYIKTSIFDYSESLDEYRKDIRKACLEYSDMLEGKTPVADGDKEKHMELLHEMAWLEHRRWNAYRHKTNPIRLDGVCFISDNGRRDLNNQMRCGRASLADGLTAATL